MATRRESWDRLTGEAWLGNATVQKLMAEKKARPQRLADGKFSLVKDEYRLEISSFPPSMAPEDLIHRFADDPNAAVNNGRFSTITTFIRRPRGTPPVVGDLYILNFGIETGAIMTVLQSPGFGEQTSRTESWFMIQALNTEAQGSMPEFGAREFGIELEGTRAYFYTRGASRGRDFFSSVLGKAPQQLLWLAAMKGVADGINAKGGRAAPEPERNYEVTPYR